LILLGYAEKFKVIKQEDEELQSRPKLYKDQSKKKQLS
jgi:hypothetical protein